MNEINNKFKLINYNNFAIIILSTPSSSYQILSYIHIIVYIIPIFYKIISSDYKVENFAKWR